MPKGALLRTWIYNETCAPKVYVSYSYTTGYVCLMQRTKYMQGDIVMKEHVSIGDTRVTFLSTTTG